MKSQILKSQISNLHLRAESVAETNRRYIPFENIRVEGGEEGKPIKIVGHAARFNSLSQPIKTKAGTFVEKIAPGAFKKALSDSGRDLLSLRNHDADKVLARRSQDTLKVWEDEQGLAFECYPADTTNARDTITDIKAGNIKGMSFGFDDPPPGGDKWERVNGQNVRTLLEVPVKEISFVTRPAYLGTDVSVRSQEQHVATLEKDKPENERGQVPGYSHVAERCQRALDNVRSTWDSIHQTNGMLADLDEGTLNDSEARSVRELHDQMGHLATKLNESMRSCQAHMMTTAERSAEKLRAMEHMQKRAELGLPAEIKPPAAVSKNAAA